MTAVTKRGNECDVSAGTRKRPTVFPLLCPSQLKHNSLVSAIRVRVMNAVSSGLNGTHSTYYCWLQDFSCQLLGFKGL